MGTSGLTLLWHRIPDVSIRVSAGWMLLSVVGSVLILYWPSFAWLGGEWTSTRGLFSHGYLIAGICIFLLFRSVRTLDTSTVTPCWWAIPVVLALSFIWLLGYASDVAAVQTMLLPVIVLTAVFAAFGRSAMMAVIFAISYLYFAIPAWEHLRFVFQNITTAIVDLLIRLVDIPVYVEGNFVYVPAGTFEISGGCSGLGFILVGTSLAALYGKLFYASNRDKWLLVGISFLLAVLVNWVRVFSIVLIGNASDMNHPLVADHSTFGWILFTIAMVPMFYIAYRIQPESQIEPNASEPLTSGSGTNAAIGVSTVLVILSLAVAPAWGYALRARYAQLEPIHLSLPQAPDRWSGPAAISSEWQPRYVGASEEVYGEYHFAGDSVWLYANVYQTQTQGRELIHFENSAVGDLKLETTRVRRLNLPDTLPGKVIEVEAAGIDHRWLIWYWYEIGGRWTTGEAKAKGMQALAFISGNPSSGIVALATRCRSSCSATTARMQDFISEAGTELRLDSMLQSGRSR